MPALSVVQDVCRDIVGRLVFLVLRVNLAFWPSASESGLSSGRCCNFMWILEPAPPSSFCCVGFIFKGEKKCGMEKEKTNEKIKAQMRKKCQICQAENCPILQAGVGDGPQSEKVKGRLGPTVVQWLECWTGEIRVQIPTWP